METDHTQAQSWVVTVRQPGSIKPVGFEYFATKDQAQSRQKQMREQIKRKGQSYVIHVGEVIGEVQSCTRKGHAMTTKISEAAMWAWLNPWREIVYNGTRAECLRWYATQSSTLACDLVKL